MTLIPLIGNVGSGNGAPGADGEDAEWIAEVTALSSSAPGNIYANKKTYVPLVRGAGDDVCGGFTANYTGTIEVAFVYAMSSSHAGNVLLTFAHAQVGAGEDPSAALTAEAEITLTPGANTTTHTLDSSVAAVLEISVTDGDDVTFTLTRGTAGGDTHTGDLRILRVFARQT